MIVKFDALNRFERPLFYLCNPGTKYEDGVLTKAIGILSDTSDEELNVEFNTTSTLSLRAYKRDYEDPDENEFFHDLFNKIQNRRLIYIEDLGFFVIRNTETGYDDGITYKDIEAYSCEDEIANKQVPYIADDTYAFEDLLDMLIKVIPMWQKGYVEPSLKDKHRTFEDVDTDQNILDFMIEDMQEAYECIFTFDTIHRSVQVYEQENYVHETDIHITKNDIVTNVTVQEDSNDMYTALSVYGDGDLTISAVNPLGGSTIYNFDYYLDWMSPKLSAKVKKWQDLVKYYSNYNAATPDKDNYPKLGEQYATQYTEYLESVAQIEMLKTRRDMYQRCYDNIIVVSGNVQVSGYNEVIVSTGGTPIPENIEDVEELQAAVKALIDEAKADIAKEEARRDQLDAAAKATLAKMQAINKEVDITTYFTYEEYEELSCYISEGTYTDQYVIITDVMTYAEQYAQLRTLFQRALGQLEKISKPTEEFSLDTENFLFQQSFSHFAGQLETGCIINVGVATDEVVPLFLSAMVVNYDDLTLSLTFGNRFCRFDPKAMFKDVLGDVKRSSNSIEFLKDAISPLEHGGIEKFREHLAELRDLSKQHALEATNQSVVIDDTGYTGKKVLGDYDFDPKQIKIVNNGIFLTKDAWDTCDVAIGELTFLNEDGSEYYEYGINAHILAGDIIIGSELHLLYNDVTTGENKDVMERMNSFEFGENGLNSKVSTKDYTGEIIASLINQTADTIKILAEHIALEGLVTANDNFMILDDGTLSCQKAQINDALLENMTLSGDISITGNITWNANNSPCLAVYARNNIPAPADGTAYSTFYSTSATTWHRVLDTTNDFYVSYTYDGGSTWTDTIRYQGKDGKNGSDASVTRESMVQALLNNLSKHPEDGIYSERGTDGNLYIGVQATVIKGYLILGDNLSLTYPGGQGVAASLTIGSDDVYEFSDNRDRVSDNEWTITTTQTTNQHVFKIGSELHTTVNALDVQTLYSEKIGCKDIVCNDLNVETIHAHTGLTVPNDYGIKTYPRGKFGQDEEITLAYMDTNDYLYYGNAAYPAQFYGKTVVIGTTESGMQDSWSQYVDVTAQSVDIHGNNISLFNDDNQGHYIGLWIYKDPQHINIGSQSFADAEFRPEVHIYAKLLNLHDTPVSYFTLDKGTAIKAYNNTNMLFYDETTNYVILGDNSKVSQVRGSTIYIGNESTSGVVFSGTTAATINFNNKLISNFALASGNAIKAYDNSALVYLNSGTVFLGNNSYSTQVAGKTATLGSTSDTTTAQILGDNISIGRSGSTTNVYGSSIDFHNISVKNLSVSTQLPSSLSLTSLSVSSTASFSGTSVSLGSSTVSFGSSTRVGKITMSNNTQIAGGTSGITLLNGYNNGVYLGDTSATTILRGSTIRLNSTSGETVTSDKRNKCYIENIDDPYETFMMNLQPVRYKYNNGNTGRYHTGFIAQDVMDAMITAGLDSTEFGGYIDLDGTGELGLIYSEFISLNTYMIQKLYRRIEDLERKVELLSRN